MAVTDENMVMPVSPMGYNNSNMGGFGGDGWWIILLFILLGNNGMWGGFGNGWGMMNGMWGMDGLYPWLNNSQNINNGFRDQQISTQINGIQNSITSGFGDVQLGIAGINQNVSAGTAAVQNSLCTGFNGVNGTINNAQNAITQQMYANQIADLERSFAAQTANTQGMTVLQSQLAQCCCDNRAGLADLRYTIATENCADRTAISDGIRDLLTATQNQTQTILNQLCADKIEAKNDTIAQLRSELLYARGQASQDVQTAAIQAGQRTLANEVEQYVAPKAVPAYIVQNPNCCYNACGCGA